MWLILYTEHTRRDHVHLYTAVSNHLYYIMLCCSAFCVMKSHPYCVQSTAAARLGLHSMSNSVPEAALCVQPLTSQLLQKQGTDKRSRLRRPERFAEVGCH